MPNSKISALTSATTPLAGTEVLPIVQSSTTKQVSVANLTAGRTVGTGALNTTGKITVNLDGAPGLRLNNTTGGVGQGIEMLTATAKYSWLLGAQYNVDQTFEITASTANGGTTFSTPLFTVNGSSGNVRVTTGNLVIGTAGKGIDFSANSHAAGMTSELLTWYEEGTWTPNQGSGLTVVGSFSSSGTYTRIGRIVVLRGTVNGSTSIAVSASGIISSNPPFTPGTTGFGTLINDAVSASSVSVISTGGNVYSVTAITATPAIAFQVIYTV